MDVSTLFAVVGTACVVALLISSTRNHLPETALTAALAAGMFGMAWLTHDADPIRPFDMIRVALGR